MSLAKLKIFFDQISPVPEDEWQQYTPYCIVKKYKKNQYILRNGDYSPYLTFIIEGMVKRSYTNQAGKEFVHYFGHNNKLIGAFSSIITRQPAKVDILTIKDSAVVHFNYEKYRTFFNRHKCWERISRVLLEGHFLGIQDREYQLLMLNAEQRYSAFLQEYADYKDDLTNKDIASFLGITPEAFSRLKKNL